MAQRRRPENTFLAQELESGASRVFNCVSKTRALRAAGASPEQRLFRTPQLNNVIIIKEASGDIDDPDSFGRVKTKLYFPYNEDNPHEGGQSVFYSDSNLEQILKNNVGLNRDAHPEDTARDMMILEIFDSLPTVDPFLVRDRLEIEDISVNPMYLAISENEWQAIQRHIIQRFRTIIDFAFADEGLDRGGEKLRTLVRKLWVARDVEGLDPIVSALQLPRQDAAAILYAWKGILYYDYKVAHMRSDFDGFAQWLNQDAVPSDAPAAEQQRLIKALREDTAKAFRGTWSGIHQILGDYNKSYDELFVHRRSPAPFINFMRRAHKHFWVLGTHIARADHALDLWDKMTYRHYHRRVRSDVLFQLLQAIHDMQRGAA